MPARKPVPGPTRQSAIPAYPITEHTESIYSDDGDDDASTILGDTGRSQRKPASDVFRPLPPGRTIASWLGGNGFQRQNSVERGANRGQSSNSAKSRPGTAD